MWVNGSDLLGLAVVIVFLGIVAIVRFTVGSLPRRQQLVACLAMVTVALLVLFPPVVNQPPGWPTRLWAWDEHLGATVIAVDKARLGTEVLVAFVIAAIAYALLAWRGRSKGATGARKT
jgi:hypothetical protein